LAIDGSTPQPVIAICAVLQAQRDQRFQPTARQSIAKRYCKHD
jgi:hypothetical protein